MKLIAEYIDQDIEMVITEAANVNLNLLLSKESLHKQNQRIEMGVFIPRASWKMLSINTSQNK